jgi:hypothetical protein
MTKRLHVLNDTGGLICVIFSEVAVIDAAHKRELITLARAAGLVDPISIVSTSPIQSRWSLAELGLDALRVLRYSVP